MFCTVWKLCYSVLCRTVLSSPVLGCNVLFSSPVLYWAVLSWWYTVYWCLLFKINFKMWHPCAITIKEAWVFLGCCWVGMVDGHPLRVPAPRVACSWSIHHYTGEWYSVMDCIGFAPSITLCKSHIFCSITLELCCKQDECFGIFLFYTRLLLFTLSIRLVLWSNYNVVDPSSVFSFHSHSTL